MGELKACSLDLLEALVHSPTDHPPHLRRMNQVTKSLAALLHTARSNEGRALVLQHLKMQVERKETLIEELRAELPRLEAAASNLERGADSDGSASTRSVEWNWLRLLVQPPSPLC